MTDNSEIKTTTKLVCFLVLLKQKEITLCEGKMLQLKEIMLQDPTNSVNEYKYNLAKMRYDQLKRTTKGLQRLEEEILKK